MGKPFVFPRPIVHITDRFFQTPGHEEFLLQVCDVAGDKGNTYFVFDRGQVVSISECGCLNFESDAEAVEYARTPWKMRYAAIQSVTINLPRLGYKAGGDEASLFSLITEIMELSAKAHEQKRGFIERLLSYGDEGPLSLLTMDYDGSSYLKMNRASYLIGMVGLNELVKIHTGAHLHESADARDFGLSIIRYMRKTADELSTRRGMKFILVQSPAESTAYRFARLDLKHFSPRAGHFVRGDISEGEVYYTNSTLLDVSSSTDPLEKVALEGTFHPLIDGGAVTHIWLGAAHPPQESLARFIIQVFKDTNNRRLTFSPDFTTCVSCKRTARGLFDHCPFCNSDEVDGVSKITGYFSKISSWNKGKLAELRDRKRNGAFLE